MDSNSGSVAAVERLGTSFKNEQIEERLVGDVEEKRCCGCSETQEKTFIGLLIVLFLAMSWVGAQQFAQSAVTSEDFDSPYFVTWFSTCWMTLCFPGYFLFLLLTRKREERAEDLRGSLLIFGERLEVRQIFSVIFPFNVLWIAVNYLYVFSLKYIAATDASAIMASNVAFCYLLSLLMLGEKVFIIRAVASLICISGVVLFGYADGFQGGSNVTVGVILALVAAIGSALYKVVFKKVVGNASLGQVSLFLTLLGVTNALLMWVGLMVLYFVGWEQMTAGAIPWGFLCGSAALGLVFNFLVNFGVAFTFPLFISVAMMLGIPMNAAVDMLLRGDMFSELRLVAALLVVAGFALMMCPDPWNLPLHRHLTCITSQRCYGNEEAAAYSSGEIRKGNTAKL